MSDSDRIQLLEQQVAVLTNVLKHVGAQTDRIINYELNGAPQMYKVRDGIDLTLNQPGFLPLVRATFPNFM